jgi:hypothetical protein
VNGFQISVSNPNGYFNYQTGMQMAIVPQRIPPGYSTITHGSRQKEGYTIHFFPSNSKFTAISVHVLQGNFGIIYHEKNGGLLWPEVKPGIDKREFAKFTLSQYGISPLAFGPKLKNLS